MRKGKIRINVNDIIGKCSGELEVISYEGHSYDATNGGLKMRHFYKCRCSCGTVKLVQRDPIICDIVHSCGCKRRSYYGN